jgi:hypothetical protein
VTGYVDVTDRHGLAHLLARVRTQRDVHVDANSAYNRTLESSFLLDYERSVSRPLPARASHNGRTQLVGRCREHTECDLGSVLHRCGPGRQARR